MTTNFCNNCGAQLQPTQQVCLKCGRVISTEAFLTGRNRIVAAILALLLGTFGIHKFYLGKPVQGIVYILFSWTFLPSLISFIEGIIYLCMTDAEFDRKYNYYG